MARSSAAHRVLLLAGTAEARKLAAALSGLADVEAVASLAGVTRQPRPLALPVRSGGFGGAVGLEAWLRAHGTAAVIDATHPFAAGMQANAVAACAAAGVPRLRVLRPAWPVRPGWMVVPSLAAAAEALPSGARVLLTSGRDVAPFAARTDCSFWVRTIEPVPLPGHMHPITGTPPFDQVDEMRLMRRLAADHIVAKNSGGDPAKLNAAEALGVAVVMVARPAPPPGPVLADPAAAVEWLRAVLDRRGGLAER